VTAARGQRHEDFACGDEEEEQQKLINKKIPSGLPLLCEKKTTALLCSPLLFVAAH
jgi:hypothetical protein